MNTSSRTKEEESEEIDNNQETKEEAEEEEEVEEEEEEVAMKDLDMKTLQNKSHNNKPRLPPQLPESNLLFIQNYFKQFMIYLSILHLDC